MQNINIEYDTIKDNSNNYTMMISKMPFYKSLNNNVFIYENVLSKSLLEECENFAYKCIYNDIYTTTNHISWPKYIVENSDIIKIIRLDNENTILNDKICYELKRNFNFITEGLKLNIHIMKENCYVYDHHDDHVLYTFTIYLNKNWQKEYGGIFQFDIDDKIYNILPKYNSMVLLKNNIHRVTKINSNVTRISLQGFYSETFFHKNTSINYLFHDKSLGIIKF